MTTSEQEWLGEVFGEILALLTEIRDEMRWSRMPKDDE